MIVDMVIGSDSSTGFSKCMENPSGLISSVTPLTDPFEVVMETGHLIVARGYFRFSISEAMPVPLVRLVGFFGPKKS